MLGLWGTVITVVQILGILHAVHAVLRARTYHAAIAWAISLAAMPWIALPLYWLLGRNRLREYIESRRIEDLKLAGIVADALERLDPHRTEPADNPAAELARAARELTKLPCTSANECALLIDGGDGFSVMLEAISEAVSYVLVQFFIVEDGKLSEAYKRVLAEKAAEGVRVFFLYDELGSHRLTRRYVRELRGAGIRVSSFRAILGRRRLQLNFRNHRKITVVDGDRAFVGGLNLGDEYIGRTAALGAWRDTHLAIRGPAVQAIQLAFLEDWHWATGDVPELNHAPRPAPGANLPVIVFPTGPADELQACRLFILQAINAARKRLWIASPYFVPGPEVSAALQLAAVRGVDVRILLPDYSDHVLVYLAAFSYYEEMLIPGVKLFRYGPGFMHQKVILVDDGIATVGTVNLDNRSFHLNFEITVAVADRGFATEVAGMLTRDFANSRRVTTDDFRNKGAFFRFAALAARLFEPVL